MAIISGSRQVNVNGTIFSFNQFTSEPDKYMELIRPFFRQSTMIRRPEVTMINHLNNLFCLMYYKKGLAYRPDEQPIAITHRRRVNRINACTEDQILSALGIDIVKHNPKISKIIFKNSGNTYRMKNSDMDDLAKSLKNATDLTRNNLDVSLGIELEFVGDRSMVSSFNEAMMILTNGRYEYKGCYNKNEGKKWILGYDGSINHRDSYPMSGFELTSPILHFTSKDMAELKAVIDLIKDILHGYTNRSCGTHIHMSFKCGSATPELCAHFGKSYRYNEDGLFDKLVPSYRRLNRSRWCRCTSCTPAPGRTSDRYRKLNFANVKKNSDQLHLEFRQLDGTLDYDKIHAWIKLQKLFSELTMDSWNSSKECSTVETDKDKDKDSVKILTITDIVTCKEFEEDDLESVLKMASMIA